MEFTKPFSEATAEKIDQEVLHDVLVTAYRPFVTLISYRVVVCR